MRFSIAVYVLQVVLGVEVIASALPIAQSGSLKLETRGSYTATLNLK